MTSVEDIEAAIEEKAKGKYTQWMIGLISDPREARRHNGNPPIWFQWQISENFGLVITHYFQKKDMNVVLETVAEDVTHVYIASQSIGAVSSLKQQLLSVL